MEAKIPIFVKNLQLLLVLTAFLVFSAAAQPQLVAQPLVGDLNADYTVDFEDLRTFVWQWLDPDCLVFDCTADLDGVDGVNMADFALLAKNWRILNPHIIISEFMASNASSEPLEDGELLDGNGDSSDWLEIYNPTYAAISLDGWYLTNDKDDLTMWQFPDGLVVWPGKFLIVFASEKTQEQYPYNYPYLDPDDYYHTNFNLDIDGDYLALVTSDGNTAVSYTHLTLPTTPYV